MKLARFGMPGEEVPVAQFDDGTWRDLRPITSAIDGTFLATNGIDRARHAHAADSLPIYQGDPRVGAPVARPGKIVCIGLNYRDHAAETGAEVPAEPIVFLKDPGTVIGPNDDVLIPRGSTKTDWEVELGVVIGAQARYLESVEEAEACIAGYVLSHDISEREFQLERGGQWDKGKSCETFNPLGPWLLPADDIRDPQALQMHLSVNGVVRQKSSTAEMIFGAAKLIRYLSQFMVLEPGDLINTGTPAGVAMGTPGQPYLRDGDVVELEIEGLGRARQRMVDA